jgi:tRNA-modifying protein YgfZ
MRSALKVIALEHLGIVRIRGVDALKFLQGQLSNDVAQLSAQRSLLAGYHNPQGRTIALIRLVQWDADDILAVVPRELATVVASRLSKFVLRAKVKVLDESAAWRVSGLVDAAPATAEAALATSDAAAVAAGAQGALALHELPAPVGAQARGEGAVYVCVGDRTPRWLVIWPADGPSPALDYPVGDRETWQRLDVAAGQAQVYGATSEEFVAQMLNLDALNAISFDKGCYTGQEVIARAHYRGRVKRRMQRFVSREACQLSPGDSGQLADGRTFKVVQAAQLADGRCDFLAVAPLVGAVSESGDANSKLAPAAAAESGAAAAPVVTTTLAADQAALPYPLPD